MPGLCTADKSQDTYGKNHVFLLPTTGILAQKVFFVKVPLQVEVVTVPSLRFCRGESRVMSGLCLCTPTMARMVVVVKVAVRSGGGGGRWVGRCEKGAHLALEVGVAHMLIQLVGAVVVLITKLTLAMVTVVVGGELRWSKEGVFERKDVLVLDTHVAELAPMGHLHVLL